MNKVCATIAASLLCASAAAAQAPMITSYTLTNTYLAQDIGSGIAGSFDLSPFLDQKGGAFYLIAATVTASAYSPAVFGTPVYDHTSSYYTNSPGIVRQDFVTAYRQSDAHPDSIRIAAGSDEYHLFSSRSFLTTAQPTDQQFVDHGGEGSYRYGTLYVTDYTDEFDRTGFYGDLSATFYADAGTDSNTRQIDYRIFSDGLFASIVDGSYVTAEDGNPVELNSVTLNFSLFEVPDVTPPPSAVPEPSTWAMMVAGIGMAGAALRRRRALSLIA